MLHRWSETWFWLPAASEPYIRKSFSPSSSLTDIVLLSMVWFKPAESKIKSHVRSEQCPLVEVLVWPKHCHVSHSHRGRSSWFCAGNRSSDSVIPPASEEIWMKSGLNPLQQGDRLRGESLLLLNLLAASWLILTCQYKKHGDWKQRYKTKERSMSTRLQSPLGKTRVWDEDWPLCECVQTRVSVFVDLI